MNREEIATSALQDIASEATRCVPCGYRDRLTDAATIGIRFFLASSSVPEVKIPLCAECLAEESRHGSYDMLMPVIQPKSVRVAREALKAIEAVRP
jgi:hypothetical protein